MWQSTRTIFFLPWPYRVLNYARNWSYDLVALIPLVLFLAWWTLSASNLPAPASDASVDSFNLFMVQQGFVRYAPGIIAILLATVILRVERRSASPRRLRHNAAVLNGLSAVSLVTLVVLAGLELWFLPGSLPYRFAPTVVAVLWAGFIRRRFYVRTRLWVQTQAGFRPPIRLIWRSKIRRVVRDCENLDPAQYSTTASERMDAAIAACADDADLRAWCVARAIEFDLSANSLVDAEKRIRDAECDAEVRQRRAYYGAKGQFLLAVGRRQDARRVFTAAEGRRLPYRLRTLLYQSGESELAVPRRWAGLARIVLVWNRQFYVLIYDLLRQMESLHANEKQPSVTMQLAFRIRLLVQDLGRPSAYSDLDRAEARDLQLARAAAEEAIGAMLSAQCRFHDAVEMFTSAMNIYRVQGYRPRSGAAGVSAAVAALRLPSDGPAHEAVLLDLLRGSLQEIELDRGQLRDATSRLELIRARDRDRLYRDALEVLGQRVHHSSDRAAELALWLLESMHRTALGDAIRRGAHSFDPELAHLLDEQDAEEAKSRSGGSVEADDGEGGGTASQDLLDLRRRLSEKLPDAFGDAVFGDPIDLTTLHRALDGRVALYYDCYQVSAGWQVTAVLTSHLGTHLHQAMVAEEKESEGDKRNVMRSAGGLLAELSSGDRTRIQMVHVSAFLEDTSWADLAAAILPPQLADTLHDASAPGFPAVLCVIPDGPLCMVPFGALHLTGDRMLVDEASISLLPNLSSLPEPPDPTVDVDTAVPLVATHLGPTRFAARFEAARRDSAPIRVYATETRADLLTALGTSPPPSLAVISHHGDHGTWLSAHPAGYLRPHWGSWLSTRRESSSSSVVSARSRRALSNQGW
jgi:tetratricopeptide (TPR) repeat protein